ncbi:MAG: DOPA 4,5-dioxygenase family protein [Burkholderiaceae bacterium]|jgi:DOPA 4,5-dioxygenase
MTGEYSAQQNVLRIWNYHAHVYFHDAQERGWAERLRESVGKSFSVQLGRWHEGPVGPHTVGMYQIAFGTEEFSRLVPWLMTHRYGLSILVHPNTGEPRADHMQRAIWLGPALVLKPETLSEADPFSNEDRVVPNTSPKTDVPLEFGEPGR